MHPPGVGEALQCDRQGSHNECQSAHKALSEHSVCSLGMAICRLSKTVHFNNPGTDLATNKGLYKEVRAQSCAKVSQALCGDVYTCAMKALFSCLVVFRLD